ncbi:sensor histidine kinase [Sporolactobacillus shoreicorticis]|uniref:histidine kinase n=1 Tax=Sporolactobacillus shoreicorticis TaxID=1923877 RepID=A0ABW5RXL8_9BACL|nr:sensor histidine kinase [Sporolactobacillus shoreicorticis]MCO7124927.1 sensor histidine kinase [Sporolactobacillus shoreicorticis]
MHNYRIRTARFQFIVSFFSSLLLFAAMQIFFWFVPSDHALLISALSFFCSFLIQFVLETNALTKDYRLLLDHLDSIDLFVKTLSSGKLSARMNVESGGAISHVEQSLNELADKIDTQVKSLQRLVDENVQMNVKVKNEAVTAERQRLARDLHDAVSQQLFALSMLASAAEKTIHSNPDLAAENIADVSDIARKAQGEMRALLLHLRPVRLNNESLDRGLERLIRELDGKTMIHFEASIDPVPGLTKGVENHLFRLSQEALSNALRHSEATRVVLSLHEKDQLVTLTVFDNGQGFDPKQEKVASYGLKTMKERAEEIGGHFMLATHEGEGTSIHIRVPIHREEKGI